jgi:leucyl aminopeptidase (aminopeptidase T)
MSTKTLLWRIVLAATLTPFATSVVAEAPDLELVARNLVRSAMVAPGEKVWITGSVRDAALLEDIAIETMKAGGQPLISISSDQLDRRSYDEVPDSYDTIERTLDVALVQTMDVAITIDVAEAEDPLAGVPEARRTARAKAYEPVNQALFEHRLRIVNLGNGLYPTNATSQRLGIAQAELAATFWKAAGVSAEVLRAKGEALRGPLSNAKSLTITHANGTDISFGVDAGHVFISDGAITPEKMKQGGAAVFTWLPAGELILPVAPGTANGKVVIDKVVWHGQEVRGLTLSYTDGRLTSMTASSNSEELKAAYDAAGGGKDQFAFVDIGLNPETKMPLGSGRVIWTALGSVTVGLGDNRAFGGSNASDFGLATQLPEATLQADGTTVVERGSLR